MNSPAFTTRLGGVQNNGPDSRQWSYYPHFSEPFHYSATYKKTISRR